MACEKCWSDAFVIFRYGNHESQSDAYQELLKRVEAGLRKKCTPEEQCGVGTTEMHTISGWETSCACGLKRESSSSILDGIVAEGMGGA